MSNTQSDILQIIRKEEDHAMSLLAASPLLSSLFLTYANRAATLNGPPNPSPVDIEWTEMKTLNDRLQEEVASLQAQLIKETDRIQTAEDCVEALRAQLASVKDANRGLEVAASGERVRLEIITSEYARYKEEAEDTIAELRNTTNKEAVSHANSLARDHKSHSAIECPGCVKSGHRGPTNNACQIEGAERESLPVSCQAQRKPSPCQPKTGHTCACKAGRLHEADRL